MLQRKMDRLADYGTPLVLAKKGWIQKFLNRNKNEDKIPVISSAIVKQSNLWKKLKYIARIETPLRIVGVVILGTLLGAAYAVTVQSGNKQITATPIVATDQQEVATENIVIQKELTDTTQSFSGFQATLPQDSENISIALKGVAPEVEEEAVMFTLSSPDKSLKVIYPKESPSSENDTAESIYSNIVIPERLVPDVAEAALSEYEQKIIMELEKKLSIVQLKLEKIDMSNLRLQGKFETLVVKNRALSDQLRHIDTVTESLKSR